VEPLPSNGCGFDPGLPGASPVQSALIFGPEERGLSNTELNYAQRFVYIPSNPEYPSLNLAQAVAICCYELSQSAPGQLNNPSLVAEEAKNEEVELNSYTLPLPRVANETAPAAFEVVEGYYQQLEAVLLKIGYLYPHTATSRMEKFRRLFNRSQLSNDEVRMLRGILSQVAWALQADSDR